MSDQDQWWDEQEQVPYGYPDTQGASPLPAPIRVPEAPKPGSEPILAGTEGRAGGRSVLDPARSGGLSHKDSLARIQVINNHARQFTASLSAVLNNGNRSSDPNPANPVVRALARIDYGTQGAFESRLINIGLGTVVTVGGSFLEITGIVPLRNAAQTILQPDDILAAADAAICAVSCSVAMGGRQTITPVTRQTERLLNAGGTETFELPLGVSLLTLLRNPITAAIDLEFENESGILGESRFAAGENGPREIVVPALATRVVARNTNAAASNVTIINVIAL